MGELMNDPFNKQAIIALFIFIISLDVVLNIIYGRPLFSGLITKPKWWMIMIVGIGIAYIWLVNI